MALSTRQKWLIGVLVTLAVVAAVVTLAVLLTNTTAAGDGTGTDPPVGVDPGGENPGTVTAPLVFPTRTRFRGYELLPRASWSLATAYCTRQLSSTANGVYHAVVTVDPNTGVRTARTLKYNDASLTVSSLAGGMGTAVSLSLPAGHDVVAWQLNPSGTRGLLTSQHTSNGTGLHTAYVQTSENFFGSAQAFTPSPAALPQDSVFLDDTHLLVSYASATSPHVGTVSPYTWGGASWSAGTNLSNPGNHPRFGCRLSASGASTGATALVVATATPSLEIFGRSSTLQSWTWLQSHTSALDASYTGQDGDWAAAEVSVNGLVLCVAQHTTSPGALLVYRRSGVTASFPTTPTQTLSALGAAGRPSVGLHWPVGADSLLLLASFSAAAQQTALVEAWTDSGTVGGFPGFLSRDQQPGPLGEAAFSSEAPEAVDGDPWRTPGASWSRAASGTLASGLRWVAVCQNGVSSSGTVPSARVALYQLTSRNYWKEQDEG